MKLKKRILSLLLCGAMLFSLCSQSVLAEENGQAGGVTIGTSGLCEHHPEHNADCGYTEGTAGTPCVHEHTVDCYPIGTPAGLSKMKERLMTVFPFQNTYRKRNSVTPTTLSPSKIRTMRIKYLDTLEFMFCEPPLQKIADSQYGQQNDQ